MRNCVVPKCDYKNKHNPKRAMFNVPIKDPDLLKQWQAVLPVRRPLKEFDRVCDQHFREEDILRYWEHTINGTVERMERHKPALKPNSVPVFGQTEEEDEEEQRRVETVETPRKRKERNYRSPEKVRKMKLTEDQQAVENLTIAEPTQAFDSSTVHLSIENLEESVPVQVEQLSHPDFDTLYDEVYEVELPSTLWGIHRDVQRTFIAFTEFSKQTMNVRKYLFIDRYLQYRMAVGQRVMKRGTLSSGLIESVTELLSKLDEIKIRKVIIKGSSSILGQ
ncbi:AAEL001600-PB [Aedes aegypti]|uniref:AAEL001600-PB n=1 Tax=Aedes aegypti TaxID=7159 RepID=Q17KN5_AEDAE|nr:AAEL001600-PB [Aedes aegypti]